MGILATPYDEHNKWIEIYGDTEAGRRWLADQMGTNGWTCDRFTHVTVYPDPRDPRFDSDEGLWEFRDYRTETAHFVHRMPCQYVSGSPVYFMVNYLQTSAGTVGWKIEHRCAIPGGQLPAALDAAYPVTLARYAFAGAPDDRLVQTSVWAPIDSSALVKGGVVHIDLTREHDHADDTMDESAWFIALTMFYKIDRQVMKYGELPH